MAKKTGKSNVPGISDPELLRPRVLKNLLDLMEETPPLGERYEERLKDLIFQAYEDSNGKLGDKEQAFWTRSTNTSPITAKWMSSSMTPKLVRSWLMVPIRYLLKETGS